MKTTHKYLTSIDGQLWEDVSHLKQVDSRITSYNQMMNEGLRMLLQQRLAEMHAHEKNRSILSP